MRLISVLMVFVFLCFFPVFAFAGETVISETNEIVFEDGVYKHIQHRDILVKAYTEEELIQRSAYLQTKINVLLDLNSASLSTAMVTAVLKIMDAFSKNNASDFTSLAQKDYNKLVHERNAIEAILNP